jgi:hypothetical protein
VRAPLDAYVVDLPDDDEEEIDVSDSPVAMAHTHKNV